MAEPWLRTWKEIARHMNRDARTLQNWVKTKNLPVVRLGRSVSASPNVLDLWLVETARLKHAQRAKRRES